MEFHYMWFYLSFCVQLLIQSSEGLYSCVANNSVGEAVATIYVNVQGKILGTLDTHVTGKPKLIIKCLKGLPENWVKESLGCCYILQSIIGTSAYWYTKTLIGMIYCIIGKD